MASDGHSAEWRPPVLSKGLQMATEIMGPDEAQKLVNDYPALILSGKPLPEKDLDRPLQTCQKEVLLLPFLLKIATNGLPVPLALLRFSQRNSPTGVVSWFFSHKENYHDYSSDY